MKRKMSILAAAVLLAFAPLAKADDIAANPGQTRVATRLATSFTTVAGSRDNALALVTGLRNGTPVTLVAAPAGATGDPVATTFTPPTRPMGWGNVSHALSLAQYSLASLGIANPTNAQLQAALVGGNVTAADGSTVTLRGILQMRADGMGWGQIAHASGTTMGSVVSSTRAMQGREVGTTATNSRASGTATPTMKASTGVTAGASASTAGGKAERGLTTASGVSSSAASKGLVTAQGSISSQGRSGGVTTAASGSGGGNAYGRGLVTASGGSVGAGVTATAAQGHGAGVISATGASASPNASVTSAAGAGNGNGHGQGKGKGA